MKWLTINAGQMKELLAIATLFLGILWTYLIFRIAILSRKGYLTKGEGRTVHLKAINENIRNALSDEARRALMEFKKLYLCCLITFYCTILIIVLSWLFK